MSGDFTPSPLYDSEAILTQSMLLLALSGEVVLLFSLSSNEIEEEGL